MSAVASKQVAIGEGKVAVNGGSKAKTTIAATPKKPVANSVVSDEDDSDDDDDDDDEDDSGAEDRKRTGKSSHGLRRKKYVIRKLGGASVGSTENGIVKKTIDFEFSVTLDALLSQTNPPEAVKGITNAAEILKKTWLEGDQIRTSGDPTRAVLRSITRVQRFSDAPFPIAYNLNILLKNQLEKINMKSGRLVFKAATGLTVLDEIPPGYQNHKADHAVLYEDDKEIKTGFLQLYSGLTKEQLRAGTSIYKPPNTEEPTDENKARWTMAVIVKGDGANPVIPKILYENRMKLDSYGIDYRKLYKESQKNGGQIQIPYLVGETMTESIAFGKGIKVAQDLVVDMTKTQVMLTHPHGGEPGVFGNSFKTYIQQNFSPATLAAIKNEVFHFKISLVLTFWDPVLMRNSQ